MIQAAGGQNKKPMTYGNGSAYLQKTKRGEM